MSEYEDLVELGFEGIDKFANKFHDTVYGYADKRKKSLRPGQRKGRTQGHGHDQHREPIHPQAEAPPPPPSPPHPPADLNAPIPPPPATVPLPPPPPPPPPPFQAVPQPYGAEWVPEDGGRDTRAMSDPRIRYPGPVPMPMPVPVPVAGPGGGPRGDIGMRDEPPAAWGYAGNEGMARSPPSLLSQPRERGFGGRGRESPRDDDYYYWEESRERERERDRPPPRRRRSPSWSPPRRRSAAEARYDDDDGFSPPRRERRSSSKKNKSRAEKSPSRGAGTEATVAAVLAGGLVALGARGVVELYDRHQERKARDERAQRQRHRERRRSVW